MLRNRIGTQGYEECQEDILALSGMAEDIRDALLDYQVGDDKGDPVVMSLTLRNILTDNPAAGDMRPEPQADRESQIHALRTRLTSSRLSGSWFVPSDFPPETSSPVRRTVSLLALNSCRRAHGAGYQHGNRRGCLRGTRETVLEEIELWTRDFNKPPVFWLNGLAGTGKSTVAQTIAERVFADGLLGASFFCSRDFEDRSNLHFIFPTVAFQLAHRYPAFRSHLVPLLQSNPDVIHESLYNQMGKLIVEPLRSVDVAMVIIIDALDECTDNEPQSAILSVMGRFVEEIPNVKFFITGRPEPRIKSGFRLELLRPLTDIFVLHDIEPSLIDADIRLFLKYELSNLARRHKLDGWPSDKHLDLLCYRAAGLFVYAIATIKFLDTKFILPAKQLETILSFPENTSHEGKTQFQPNKTLDSLYSWILRETISVDNSVVFSNFQFIVGAVVLLVNPLPPSAIAELVGLEINGVMPYLTSIQSLLTLDEDPNLPVRAFHKSFPDFITDPTRCLDKRLYISAGDLHLKLSISCLRLMNDGLEQNLLSLPEYTLNSEIKNLPAKIQDRVSVALQYACRSWHNHLTLVQGDIADVISHLRSFLEGKFLAWLEVVSVMEAARVAVVALEQLIIWLQEVCFDLLCRVYSH